eukprot:tig00000870_g5129.t1
MERGLTGVVRAAASGCRGVKTVAVERKVRPIGFGSLRQRGLEAINAKDSEERGRFMQALSNVRHGPHRLQAGKMLYVDHFLGEYRGRLLKEEDLNPPIVWRMRFKSPPDNQEQKQ